MDVNVENGNGDPQALWGLAQGLGLTFWQDRSGASLWLNDDGRSVPGDGAVPRAKVVTAGPSNRAGVQKADGTCASEQQGATRPLLAAQLLQSLNGGGAESSAADNGRENAAKVSQSGGAQTIDAQSPQALESRIVEPAALPTLDVAALADKTIKKPVNAKGSARVRHRLSGAWGVVASRKLAFWADLGDQRAPSLSSAESDLLWRILTALQMERAQVQGSQIVRWPLPALESSLSVQGSEGVLEFLTAFFRRVRTALADDFTILVFGNTLGSIASGAEPSEAEPISWGDAGIKMVHLPALKAMIADRSLKSAAWESLKPFRSA